jgi:hypothetical protein
MLLAFKVDSLHIAKAQLTMAMPPDLHLRRFVVDYAGQLHVWSAVLEFDDLLSDSQLEDICKLAYSQMTESYQAIDLKKKKARPAVMTAMMKPDRTTVILASSMKTFEGVGTAIEYNYANESLTKLLDKVDPQTKHRTGGCGEINCVAVWDRIKGENDTLKNSLIITWGSNKGGKCKRIAPCYQDTSSWGCTEFLAANAITPIAPQGPGMPLPNCRELTHPGF